MRWSMEFSRWRRRWFSSRWDFVVRERRLKFGAQPASIWATSGHGVARGVSPSMPNAFISFWRELGAVVRRAGRRRASTREQADADEQHQDGDGDHQPLQEPLLRMAGHPCVRWLRRPAAADAAGRSGEWPAAATAPYGVAAARDQVQAVVSSRHAVRPERLVLEGRPSGNRLAAARAGQA